MSNSSNSTRALLQSKLLPFLEYLNSIRGYSALTVRSYKDAINAALQQIEIEDNRVDLLPWRMQMATLSRATVARKLSAIRSFVKYINAKERRVVLVHDQSMKAIKRLPKPVAHQHIEQALQQAQGLEYWAILLMYALGLRIAELAALEIHSISSGWVRVTGKGRKEREIPISAALFEAIESFIAKNRSNRYLFEVNEKKLSENSLRYLVNKAFKRIGMHVTPHQLRHSFATELLNSGARIADVSELLGHEHMATTQIYTKLGSTAKMQQYHNAHPLCQKEEES